LNKNYKSKQQKVSIQNVISSFKLDRKLDLKEIHLKFKEKSTFDKYTFNYGVVVLKIDEPKMSFLIYRTGKIISTGSKSIQDAQNSAKIILKLFERNELDAKLSQNVTIDNIVATYNLGRKINLNLISERNFNIDYQPETFPGLIYRSKNPKGTVLLFSSGKIVCTGFKEIENMLEVIDLLEKKIIN